MNDLDRVLTRERHIPQVGERKRPMVTSAVRFSGNHLSLTKLRREKASPVRFSRQIVTKRLGGCHDCNLLAANTGSVRYRYCHCIPNGLDAANAAAVAVVKRRPCIYVDYDTFRQINMCLSAELMQRGWTASNRSCDN